MDSGLTFPYLNLRKLQSFCPKECGEGGMKNYNASTVLPYSQANKLAWYSFMDACRRHEMPRSEMKKFITAIAVVREQAQ